MSAPPPCSDPRPYGNGPCYPELVAVVIVGLTHVGLELAVSETAALRFSGIAAVPFVGYLVWRARGGTPVLRVWGMRRDNFWGALRAQLVLLVGGAIAMLAYGVTASTLALPWTFWLTLGLYPLWGVTQQFALQNLMARNVVGLVSRPGAIAGLAAVLFAASHVPRWPLVALTLVSGFFFTLFYRREPNLWAIGLVHGLLGTLAIYLVSREDPGAVLWPARGRALVH